MKKSKLSKDKLLLLCIALSFSLNLYTLNRLLTLEKSIEGAMSLAFGEIIKIEQFLSGQSE